MAITQERVERILDEAETIMAALLATREELNIAIGRLYTIRDIKEAPVLARALQQYLELHMVPNDRNLAIERYHLQRTKKRNEWQRNKRAGKLKGGGTAPQELIKSKDPDFAQFFAEYQKWNSGLPYNEEIVRQYTARQQALQHDYKGTPAQKEFAKSEAPGGLDIDALFPEEDS